MAKSGVKVKQQITKVFETLLNEYLGSDNEAHEKTAGVDHSIAEENKSAIDESELIQIFLETPCECGKSCKSKLSFEGIAKVRREFRSLGWAEKNSFMLSQLSSCMRYSEKAKSGRRFTDRVRQKFDYHISYDRPVCREVFLFYYGETIDRLKRLQKHRVEVGISTIVHGNEGRTPKHACSSEDKNDIKIFIHNYAATHGMPDPGRDLRHGQGRLRILLPTVLNYTTVHRLYEQSLLSQGKNSLGYRSFIRCWQEVAPHIIFNKPKTDLCMTCEDFKKKLNHIAADLDEKRESEKEKIYRDALAHIEAAKKERTYYNACVRMAEKEYGKLQLKKVPKKSTRPNYRNIMQHYSWDFAQQFYYPYEDQQVGPIYFKTPRKAQLFGVCCEGIPRQTNYLIDEADFLEKDANTVISLLDHFFAYHGIGEKYACLTADNCVGQNKNNAVLHYLIYRTIAGLHDNIELSFMLVGHTKFVPDGYFGLIRRIYRRSRVYTYEDLKQTILDSSNNGQNDCQTFIQGDRKTPIIYRDWSPWLLKFFKKLPDITMYRHFKIKANCPGSVFVRTAIDSGETEFQLLKRSTTFGKGKSFQLPPKILPKKMTIERQWYLYDQIRMHIPSEKDKDLTCPKPKYPKSLNTKK